MHWLMAVITEMRKIKTKLNNLNKIEQLKKLNLKKN